MDKTYRLKGMVLLRMFVEVAMMIGLIAIPVTMLCAGKLFAISFEQRVVFIALAIISLCVMPWYGFITWQVKTDLLGLTCVSLFKKQFCAWSEIKSLSRRSNFNWLRYVIETDEQGTLNFPVLMKDCEQLIEEIRTHLPPGGGGGERRSSRTFEHDHVASFMYFAQILYGFIFIAITWSFFASINAKSHSSTDSLIVLAFCLAISGLLLWRSFVVTMMLQRVQINAEGLAVRTFFFQKLVPWVELKSVKKSSPFLPEGFMLRTGKGNFLIGSNMNAADELYEILVDRVPASDDFKKNKRLDKLK